MNESDRHDAYLELKFRLKMRLAEALGSVTEGGLDRQVVTAQLRTMLNGTAANPHTAGLTPQDIDRLIAEVSSEMVGGGPLEPLIADPTISEIMVNGPSQVYVERTNGRVEKSAVTFRDADHLMSVIERLLERAGASVTKSEPCVDASLPEGLRLNVIIPPLVLNGPTVTIRKQARAWSLKDAAAERGFSREAMEFLTACVKAKVNLVISGGTSTGKTTMVSILSQFFAPEERIITIENVAELMLPGREHWIRLVGRAANVEGKGEISLRTLVRNALRMRPDRIVLGEARGGEALDVVQAMCTGHDGVITVLHANSAPAALERLETMMLMSGLELPPEACRTQIASAVDLVIHMGRFADGSRRIQSIAQIRGTADGTFQLDELFRFDVEGFQPDGELKGTLRYTGAKPAFAQKFALQNVEVPQWIR